MMDMCAGIILCWRPANERQRYYVTSSLVAGRSHKMIPVCVSDPQYADGSKKFGAMVFHLLLNSFIVYYDTNFILLLEVFKVVTVTAGITSSMIK